MKRERLALGCVFGLGVAILAAIILVCGILFQGFLETGVPYTPLAQPPGKGPRAERGYQMSRPVIEALKQYYEKNGEYPEGLAALVPDYIKEIPSIGYRKKDPSYELEFSYEGPGVNRCVYTPEKDWNCSGHY